MATVEFKSCCACKQTLPAAAFTIDRRASTGLQPKCKKCCAAYMRAQRNRDIEAHRAYQRAYYQKNRDHCREQAQKYRAGDAEKEKIKARAKAYYRRNKEKMIEWVRESRKANPERTREWARGWQARRRALKKDGPGGAEMRAWAGAQKKVCHWCAKACAADYHIDHIVPLSRGGPHEIKNLCISCPPCNLSKGASDPIDFAQSIGKLL